MLRSEEGADKQDRRRSQVNPRKSTFHCMCLYVNTVQMSSVLPCVWFDMFVCV